MSGRPVPVAPPEAYVDRQRLAALMGVSTSTIKRWVKLGMPEETWGMRRTRRYLPSKAMAWARERQGSPEGQPDTIPTTDPSGSRSERAPGDDDNRRE